MRTLTDVETAESSSEGLKVIYRRVVTIGTIMKPKLRVMSLVSV